MPYITQMARIFKDDNEEESCSLDDLVGLALKTFKASNDPTNEDVMNVAGDLNYLITSISAGLIGVPSYAKIAIITGVLENIKQEFYRRVATPYEEIKIKDNGDIPAYLRQK